MSTTLHRFEGAPVHDEWPELRGLLYGDGVFRTLLCWRGRAQEWPRHYERLAADAARLELDVPAFEPLTRDVESILQAAGEGSGALKLLLCRAPMSRGYAPASRQSRRLLSFFPLPAQPAERWRRGIALGVSDVRLARQPRLAGIKHLNRLEQVLASRGWPGHWQEALMADTEDQVVCGTRSNVFFVSGQRLVTPALTQAGVAGVTRDRILELAVALGLPCEVRPVALDELPQMEECFLSNALIGIWPVAELVERPLVAPGAVTRELIARLAHPWQGA